MKSGAFPSGMLRARESEAQLQASQPNPEFAELLRQHRLRAGLSQEALAERAGLSARGISDLERGIRRTPYPATIARLATALGLDAPTHDALLSAARQSPPRPPEEVRGDAADKREERRWVTVLAVKLGGFAALLEQLDPEDARLAVDRCTERIADEIQRFDGTVLHSTDDSVLAVFGAPTAHEDDAERAVRAGLAISACSLLSPTDPAIHIRVGIDSGEVLAGPFGATLGRSYALSGAPATAATSLAESSGDPAAPATVLVGEHTYRVTQRQVRYASAPSVGSRATWAALEVAPTPLARILAYAPFVGRALELDVLARQYARVARERRPHLISILGEPGIGKSRLVAEFERSLREAGESRLVHGRCLPYGEVVGFGALAQALYELAGITSDESAETARARLRDLVHAHVDPPFAPDIDRHLALLCGLDAAADRPGYPTDPRAVHVSVRRLLESLAQTEPLCLVIEDLHWGDVALLDLLEDVAERARAPLLIVTQARPELLDRRPTWGGGIRAFTSLLLEPLDDAAGLQLAGALCRDRALASVYAEQVTRMAGGNPLFAEELCAAMAEGQQTGGVPTTLLPLISARLDALPPDEKRTLQYAAVLGNHIWPAAMLAMGVGGELDSHLEALERRDLLRSRPGSQFDAQREFAFKHDLIQETAYGLLPRTTRRLLHARMVGWLEATAGERIEERLDLLAHHAMAAEDHARALDYLARAADRARRAAAYREEAALLWRAISIARTFNRGELIAEFHARRGRALTRLNLWADARAALEEALAGLPEERAERRAEVLVDLSLASNWMMDGSSLRQRATEALALSTDVGRVDLALDARFWLAWSTGSDGDVESSIHQYDAAVAQSTELGVVPAPSVLPLYMTALCWAGHFPMAAERGQDALRIARAAGDTDSTTLTLQVLGLALAGTGAYDEALAVFSEAMRFGREYGVGGFLARATAMSAGFHLDVFDFDGHAAIAEEACDIARSVNFLPPLVSARIDLLLNRARRGELSDVDPLVRDVGEIVQRAAMWHGWLWHLRFTQARAEIALARQDPATAIALANAAIEQSHRHRPKYEVLGRVTRAAGLTRLGRTSDAIHDLHAAVTTARSLGDPAVFLRAGAALLSLDGDDALAAETRSTAERILLRLPTPEMRERFQTSETVRTLFSSATY